MRAYERLLKYVKIHTTSDGSSETVPSTMRQFDLANALAEEMRAMGMQDVQVDENCYVCGFIPATPGCEDADAIGFIAHMDTSPDFSGENVNPQIIENYDGEAVKLGDSGRVLSPEMFPRLRERKGQTLITTDGTTLLGADDKAGIAEILTAMEILLKENGPACGVSASEGEENETAGSGKKVTAKCARPHGKICVAFTSDEEIGSGAEHLDLERFGAKYAYTVDGDIEYEIVYETFNACTAAFEIRGVNIHPGEAKNRMVNAALLAAQINGMLPSGETPRGTEGYEGFYHLTSIKGNVESATAKFIVRDHSSGAFEARQETLRHIEKLLNEQYGEGTVKLTIRQQYRNMAEKLTDCMHLVDNAKDVIRSLGREPDISPVRGGTDGSRLSFRGLPCPNLGTGGAAFHGPYEHITVESMDFAVQVILGIIGKYA